MISSTCDAMLQIRDPLKAKYEVGTKSKSEDEASVEKALVSYTARMAQLY